MKKTYITPAIQTMLIEAEDILTLSNGGNGSGSNIDWNRPSNNANGIYN